MRLISFTSQPGSTAQPPGRPRPGLVVGDEVVDLSDPAVGLPDDMAELLALGPTALARPRRGRPPAIRSTRSGDMHRCPTRPTFLPSV